MLNTMDTSGMGNQLYSLVQAGLLSGSGFPRLNAMASAVGVNASATAGDATTLGQEAQNSSNLRGELLQTQMQCAQLEVMKNQLLQVIMQQLQQNIQAQGNNNANQAVNNGAAADDKAAGKKDATADKKAAADGKDAATDKTAGDAKPDGGGTHSNQATEVAREMAGYKYEFYYDDKKSDASTESSKAGNCCDLAQVAIKKFKEKGIEAKLVLGDVKGKSYTGGHYWIEYKDPATGKMTFFDPTAAASNKSADRAFQGLHSTYSKR
ncbi:MAG: transglutaminase domain-containing protein [Candidatus Xenobiia bacterium LiM19]